MGTTSEGARQSRFTTTHWSLVLSAGRTDDARSREALEVLCAKYWVPLYSYVRRSGHGAEDAQDLTQEFFARLLEHNWIERADQSKGRFRSFLLMVLKRFLANEWDRARSRKRGGNVRLESLSEMAETLYASQPAATAAPDVEFEREWALALLDHVLRNLERQYAEGGKAHLFAVLKGCLTGSDDQLPHARAAAELGMSEGAVKVAVSRLRQRYRDSLRQEVAATVARPEDVDSELRHLFRILARTQ